jgi:hypothetical protein
VHINDDEMGLCIVDVYSLPPLVLLNIMHDTCVKKCPIAILLLVHTSLANNALIPIFSEWLK